MKPLTLFILLVAWVGLVFASPVQAQEATPAEARAIAKEAYIWGYALVDDYRIQYAYFVDKSNPEFKGGWNIVANNTRLTRPPIRPSRPSTRTRSTRSSGWTCATSRS